MSGLNSYPVPPIPMELLEQVITLRKHGTEFFHSGSLPNALITYQRGMDLLLSLPRMYMMDPYFTAKVAEEEGKLICNISKVHRLLCNYTEAINSAQYCIDRHPSLAKGHFIMGEVCRDMFQGHVDPVPYFKVLQRAIIEFTATFRISGDKIAFLESLLLAIPTHWEELLPPVPYNQRSTVFQYAVDNLVKRKVPLGIFLNFFFIQTPTQEKQYLSSGCGKDHISLKMYNLADFFEEIITFELLEAVVDHGAIVTSAVILETIRCRHTEKYKTTCFLIDKSSSPPSSTDVEQMIEACIKVKHFDIIEFILTKEVQFTQVAYDKIMQCRAESTILQRIKQIISQWNLAAPIPELEHCIKLRNSGTTAFKNENYSEARDNYLSAYQTLQRMISDHRMRADVHEEMQKIMGNLSVVSKNLKVYDQGVDWATKLVRQYPEHAKGYYRLAEAYISKADVTDRRNRLQLQMKATDSFAKAYELSHDKPPYVHCIFIATKIDCLTKVPPVPVPDQPIIVAAVLEGLAKRKNANPKEVVHFINKHLLHTKDGANKNIPEIFTPASLKKFPLSSLPSSNLEMDVIQKLIQLGITVDTESLLANLCQCPRPESIAILLLEKLPAQQHTKENLVKFVEASIKISSPKLVDIFLVHGGQIPKDIALRKAVISWDIQHLTIRILKELYLGPKDQLKGQVLELFAKRAKYLSEKAEKKFFDECIADAGTLLQEAKECSQYLDHKPKVVAEVFYLSGVLEFKQGHLSEAYDFARRSAATKRSWKASTLLGDICTTVGKTEKNHQKMLEAMNHYMKAFDSDPYERDVFRKMFCSAFEIAYEGNLPVLQGLDLKKSLISPRIADTVRYVIQNYKKETARKALHFLLIPTPVSPFKICPAYSHELLDLHGFKLSDFTPFFNFEVWMIRMLQIYRIEIDSQSVIAAIREFAKSSGCDANVDQDSLLQDLYKKCNSPDYPSFLKAAIESRNVTYTKKILERGITLNEAMMTEFLSWDPSLFSHQLLSVVLKSKPPLRVKNSKGEGIVDIVCRNNWSDCFEMLVSRGDQLDQKDLRKLIQGHPTVPLVKLYTAKNNVTVDTLQIIFDVRRDKAASPNDCKEMADLICHKLKGETLKSNDMQMLLHSCISKKFKELVEVLLAHSVTPSHDDACNLLSWKQSRLSKGLLKSLLNNGIEPTITNENGRSFLSLVIDFEAYDLLPRLVNHYEDFSACSFEQILKSGCEISGNILEMLLGKGLVLPTDQTAPQVFRGIKKLLIGTTDKKKRQMYCSMLCVLIRKGLSVTNLTVDEAGSTTPLHIAVYFSLLCGDCSILEVSFSNYSGPLVNGVGHTPLHELSRSRIAASDELLESIFKLLQQNQVDPTTKDKNSKTALDYTNSDKIKEKLRDYTRAFDLAKETKTTKKKKKKNKKKKNPSISQEDSTPDDLNSRSEEKPLTIDHSHTVFRAPTPTSQMKKVNPVLKRVQDSIQLIIKDGFSVPKEEVKNIEDKEDEEESDGVQDSSESSSVESGEEAVSVNDISETKSSTVGTLQDQPEIISGTFTGEFDGLAWEIDCTERFWKNLTSLPSLLRKKAIGRIQRLAEGEWHAKFKKAVGSEPGLELYEMKLTKSWRIIWQKAVDFSARCTQESSNYVIYSELIRLWDVVKHKGIHAAIVYAEQSFRKGRESHVKHCLKYLESASSPRHKPPRGCIPRLYTCQDVGTEVVKATHFVPLANPGDKNYNLITFYAFTSSLVYTLLTRERQRCDFPFKGWPKEHDIINLKSKESILLLGRSGTGKTTCCVYRLWNQCHSYWQKAPEPHIPRLPLLFNVKLPKEDTQDETFEEQDLEVTHPRDPTLPVRLSKSSVSIDYDKSTVTENEKLKVVEKDAVEKEDWHKAWQDQLSKEKDRLATKKLSTGSTESADAFFDIVDSEEDEQGTKLDHLHQIFVTKNPVLVSQVKKKFYDIASGSPHMSNHLPYETVDLPKRLHDVSDEAFPLFLTSFQWLNLLDASFLDGHSFFPRDETGELMVELIDSVGEYNVAANEVELFEESDEEDEDFNKASCSVATAERSKDSNQRRILDDVYFCDNVWHYITRTCPQIRKKYNPLLIWMEIKSFLKGSFEALMSDSGSLSEEQYKRMGSKRAGNFVGDREEIYSLFLSYQKYLSQHKLVDQCDWVHHIYHRLKAQEDVPFVIHEFYIDEVQDFTQAELYLILHCCRFSSGLFFTGDTAQSIMRGVSFRFQDLRSLFHHFRDTYLPYSSKKDIIRVPQMQQLTQNFRSHSGILDVAAHVIKLLQYLFPKSIDTLPEDTGVFPGPLPVILHSISESDLAIILRGNRRMSSSIEFGAHQAVLVQSETSKSRLPEELSSAIVLTTFEAKGLEFDDVLLYNFFADSKADQEWRLVLNYFNSLGYQIDQSIDYLDKSSLRPLEFDEALHRTLNAELKYLYTAVTRAKCNLWIYDSQTSKHSPIYFLLIKLGLVQTFSLNEQNKDQDVDKVFVKQSSPEEWKKRGDYFMKRKLWSPAQKCYIKCKEEGLAKEAEAFALVNEARRESVQPRTCRQLCMQAADKFLQCLEFPGNVLERHVKNAATCFMNAKEWEFAGKLYETLQDFSKASKAYQRGKNYDKASSMMVELGERKDALHYLQSSGQHPAMLKLATKLNREGFIYDGTLSIETVVALTAEYHRARGEMDQVKECIEELSDVSDKIILYKKNTCYNEAIELLVNSGDYRQAYLILAAMKKYREGVLLAEKEKDYKEMLHFKLMEAKSLEITHKVVREIQRLSSMKGTQRVGKVGREKAASCDSPESDQQLSSKDSFIEEFGKRLKEDLLPIIGDINTLIAKMRVQQPDPIMCAEKNLLETLCHCEFERINLFKTPGNIFLNLEAYRMYFTFKRRTPELNLVKKILKLCEEAIQYSFVLHRIAISLPSQEDENRVLSELLAWYGLEKQIDLLTFNKSQDLWLSFSKIQIPKSQKRLMGLLDKGRCTMRVDKALEHIRSHILDTSEWLLTAVCDSYITKHLKSENYSTFFSLEADPSICLKKPHEIIARTMAGFVEHECALLMVKLLLQKVGLLKALNSNKTTEMCEWIKAQTCIDNLSKRLQTSSTKEAVIQHYEKIRDKKTVEEIVEDFTYAQENMIKVMKHLKVLFLPEVSIFLPISAMHYRALSEYPAVHKFILHSDMAKAKKDINAFLNAWWLKGKQYLDIMLRKSLQDEACPRIFKEQEDRDEKSHIHAFLLISKACTEINRDKPNPLYFCKLVLLRFLSFNIDKRSESQTGRKKIINTSNILILFELLTSTLVSMKHCQDRGYPSCLPMLYEHVMQMFDDTSKASKGHSHHLAKAVFKGVLFDNNSFGMKKETNRFLLHIASLLLGLEFKYFNVFKYILTGSKSFENGTLRRTLLLTLILLVNLESTEPERCQTFRKKIHETLHDILSDSKGGSTVPEGALETCRQFEDVILSSPNSGPLLIFAQDLCKSLNTTLGVVKTNRERQCIEIYELHSSNFSSLTVEFQKGPLSGILQLFSKTGQRVMQGGLQFDIQATGRESLWPEWDGGNAFVPMLQSTATSEPYASIVQPTEEYQLSQALQEDNYHYTDDRDNVEDPVAFIDQTLDVDIFKGSLCLACGISLETEDEEGHEVDQQKRIEHLSNSLHQDNFFGWKYFRETCVQANEAIKHAKTMLQYDQSISKDFTTEKIYAVLVKKVSDLESAMGIPSVQLMTKLAWQHHCDYIRLVIDEVTKCQQQFLNRLQSQSIDKNIYTSVHIGDHISANSHEADLDFEDIDHELEAFGSYLEHEVMTRKQKHL